MDLIWVRGPDYVQVKTIDPARKGYCAHGDVVELRKEDGQWEVKSISFWYS
jgi:hypothetical protein